MLLVCFTLQKLHSLEETEFDFLPNYRDGPGKKVQIRPTCARISQKWSPATEGGEFTKLSALLYALPEVLVSSARKYVYVRDGL